MVLFTGLIVVITSWATATPNMGKDDKKKGATKGAATSDQGVKQVIVESNKDRYRMAIAGNRGTENEKIIIYDCWDLMNTWECWLLSKPHTTSPTWVRMRFDKKKR